MSAHKTQGFGYALKKCRWSDLRLFSSRMLSTMTFMGAFFILAMMAIPVSATTDDHKTLMQLPSNGEADETLDRLPLMFEPNEGQAVGGIRYIARCPGATLYFHDGAVDIIVRRQGSGSRSVSSVGKAVVSAARERIRMRLVGARPFPQIEPVGKLPGEVNYFKGPDPAKWRTGIPTYRKIKYTSVYPGIDLVFYGNARMLEYDFIIRPGADPSQVRIAFDGAKEEWITEDGALVMSTRGGDRVLQHKPVVYQDVKGCRKVVNGEYRSRGRGLYGFDVAAYDSKQPLIIDPGFQFSSYIGGTDEDSGGKEWVRGIAVGADGGVYIGGMTTATDFPAISQIPGAANDSSVTVEHDAWVAKVHRSGTFLEWSTILGGIGSDTIWSLALDSGDNVVVAGTGSSYFPEVKKLYTDGGMFVTRIKSDGTELLFSTRFGGSGDGFAAAVAVDDEDNIYITGYTEAEDFPVTVGAFQTQLKKDDPQFAQDAYVMKIDPAEPKVVYSTYIGGSSYDWGRGIAVDGEGCAYIAGETASTDYPVAHAYQGAHAGGAYDCMVTKLTADGSGLAYSTFLGSADGGAGSASERCSAIAVDAAGQAYVTGITKSETFPTVNPVQGSCGGDVDAFIAGFAADGSGPLFSTYLGGAKMDHGYAIAVDAQGYVYVGGHTTSNTDFPLVDAAQPNFGMGVTDPKDWWDGFVTVYTPGGAGLHFSTYLGGNNWDTVSTLAVDTAGAIYVGGQTTSQTFPVVGGIDFPGGSFPKQNSLQGVYDGFVTKFGSIYSAYLIFSDLALTHEENADPVRVGDALVYTLTVENKGPDIAANATLKGVLSGVFDSVTPTPSVGSCTGGAAFLCELGDLDPDTTATVTLTAVPARIGTAGLEAFAYSDSGDTNTDNNDITEETDLIPASDLIPDPTCAVLRSTEAGRRSPVQTFLITNSAGVNRTVGEISLSGEDAAEFQLDSDTCSGMTLAPDAHCSVGVVMAPVAAGDKEALLNIPSDDSRFPVVEVPLSGKAYVLGPPALLLRKTGQKTSYAAGDDGDLQKGVDWPEPRFVDNHDGTITDLLTGLMWLKHSNCSAAIGLGTYYFGELTWQEALDFVAGINDRTYNIAACGGYTANYTDWRLPNANEMRSLYTADLTLGGSDQLKAWGFIPWHAPLGGDQQWWSSTTLAANNICAFTGWIRLNPIGSNRKVPERYSTSYTQAWPVRDAGITPVVPVARTGQSQCYDSQGNTIDCLGTGQDGELRKGIAWPWPSPRFLDHGDGTVTDLLTHLMWIKDADLLESDWDYALDDIADLNAEAYLGHTDWRMPNAEEMFSLKDFTSTNNIWALPADHPFINVQIRYWTSTAYNAAKRLYFDRRYGLFGCYDAEEAVSVWIVRGGPKPYFMEDAIVVLKILTGMDTSIPSRIKDINGNGTIDLAEAIFILQTLIDSR
ncbi:MAG: DUF1566 domain-containing protein [Deltaproteobacteria bacterium]|nr:DUF1566 domain-containing protein [Deltaproteobacteria bacterium]